jgi:Tetratricopeptide repeat
MLTCASTRDLNNMAELLSDTSRLAEAEPLYRRMLAIMGKSFGPNHPNVAIGSTTWPGCSATPTGWLRPSRFTAGR